jgi:Tfp pilus assembly protein PilF
MKSKRVRIYLFISIVFLSAAVSFAQTERDKGIAFYESGDYRAAVTSLEKAVARNKNDNEAWLFLGMAYARTRESNKAVSAFERSRTVRSKDADKNYDVPLKIISKRPAGYTSEARSNSVSGNVILVVEFRKDGKIGHIFPYKRLPGGLTENSIEAARRIKFEPAQRNGKPVTVINFVDYDFKTF